MQKINVSCCATTLVTRASFFALHAYFTMLYIFFFSSFSLWYVQYMNVFYFCFRLFVLEGLKIWGCTIFQAGQRAFFPKLFICTNYGNYLKSSIWKLAKLTIQTERNDTKFNALKEMHGRLTNTLTLISR